MMCNHDWIECGDEMIFRQKNRPINQVLHGNSLEVLKTLEDNSVDSIVTDPPYELGFMGKKWDSTGIAYNVDLWKECLRVLKPGGHLLAFGGTRTYHRMVCAIEDAGFEIRDCIMWIYGSGMPKSLNISKAIDKKLGAKRGIERNITAPATPEAQQWDGWGTCLKPANEPIVLARKPISEKTIAENVMKWGTGGINIDGCRIKHNEKMKTTQRSGRQNAIVMTNSSCGFDNTKDNNASANPKGRFPANVILDEEAGRMLDEQSGVTRSGKVKSDKGAYGGVSTTGFLRGITTTQNQHGDSGGASRFFYCAKASRKERGEGNNHPTVKPVKLIEYLITLVTPPNGTVLDPFFGSGTTGVAAVNLGFNFIGIELDEQYVEIAKRRINAAKEQFHKHMEVMK